MLTKIKESPKKKLHKPVTLFAAIEEKDYEAIRFISYKEHKSIAEITREALISYIKEKANEYPIHVIS